MDGGRERGAQEKTFFSTCRIHSIWTVRLNRQIVPFEVTGNMRLSMGAASAASATSSEKGRVAPGLAEELQKFAPVTATCAARAACAALGRSHRRYGHEIHRRWSDGAASQPRNLAAGNQVGPRGAGAERGSAVRDSGIGAAAGRHRAGSKAETLRPGPTARMMGRARPRPPSGDVERAVGHAFKHIQCGNGLRGAAIDPPRRSYALPVSAASVRPACCCRCDVGRASSRMQRTRCSPASALQGARISAPQTWALLPRVGHGPGSRRRPDPREVTAPAAQAKMRTPETGPPQTAASQASSGTGDARAAWLTAALPDPLAAHN